MTLELGFSRSAVGCDKHHSIDARVRLLTMYGPLDRSFI